MGKLLKYSCYWLFENMKNETFGALKRIIEEVKEKRKAKCIWIDCVVNHRIGGNDIDLVEEWMMQEDKEQNTQF